MAQNIKIVTPTYKGDTSLTNVLFRDSIRIEPETAVALTSFSAQFNVREDAVFIKGQSFVFTYQQANSPQQSITITLKDKLYISYVNLLEDLTNAIKSNFSPMNYLTADNFLDYNMFIGLNLNFSTSIYSGTDKTLTAILELSKSDERSFEFNYAEGDDLRSITHTETETTLQRYTFKGTGFRTLSNLKNKRKAITGPYTQQPENISLDRTGGVYVSLAGMTFVQNSVGEFGKSSFQFIKRSVTGEFDSAISFVYETTDEGGGDEDLPEPNFRIEITDETGAITKTIPIGDEFYNYQTAYNADKTTPLNSMPFQDADGDNTDRTLFFTQKDGFVVIGYYDPEEKKIYDLTGGQTDFAWDIESNYEIGFRHDMSDDDAVGIIFTRGQNKATANGNQGSFNQNVSVSFDFTNASEVRNTLGFETNVRFRGIDYGGRDLTYLAPFPLQLYQAKNKEIALEIDTIQLNNFVGQTTSDPVSRNGRKNIIAYFTPTLEQNQHLYNLDFTPNEPLYLKVQTKQPIDFTSMNYRLYYTIDGTPIPKGEVTFVLTNK
jgi:hypothetical protein